MFATAVMQQTCGLDRNGLIDCRKKSLVDWTTTAISPFCLFGDGSLLGDYRTIWHLCLFNRCIHRHHAVLGPREVLHGAVAHFETYPTSLLSWLAFLSPWLCGPIPLYNVPVMPHKIFGRSHLRFGNGSFDPPSVFMQFGM